MNVLLLPFFDANQYQELLREGLESRGVTVTVDDRPHPLKPFLHRVILNDVDVVHLHWTHPYFLFGSKRSFYAIPFVRYFCLFAAAFFLLQIYITKALSRRVVWTAHNKCNHERRFEEIDRWVGQKVATVADDVQVWDETTRTELEEYLDVKSEHTSIIPHGNYVGVYKKKIERKEAAQELGVEEYDRVYLYFGVIRPYKGVPNLIRAFNQLSEENACLIIAGNPMYDDLREEIEGLAADNPDVKLALEYIPDARVPVYFGACDLAVFPYKHIFNSGSVILAMSFGRAFIAPRTGCLPSVSPDGNVLYEDDLVGALRTAGEMPMDEIKIVGKENKRVAETEHDWKLIIDQTLKFYAD